MVLSDMLFLLSDKAQPQFIVILRLDNAVIKRSSLTSNKITTHFNKLIWLMKSTNTSDF